MIDWLAYGAFSPLLYGAVAVAATIVAVRLTGRSNR